MAMAVRTTSAIVNIQFGHRENGDGKQHARAGTTARAQQCAR